MSDRCYARVGTRCDHGRISPSSPGRRSERQLACIAYHAAQYGAPRMCRGAAAMQQIADWLEKLGLGQYAQRFAENDINFGILPHLTDQDLKELGIVSLGHRRQLLLAIVQLSTVQ